MSTTPRVLYSAQFYSQHCTRHIFVQFRALYTHNHDEQRLTRPFFGPSGNKKKPSGRTIAHKDNIIIMLYYVLYAIILFKIDCNSYVKYRS